MPIQFNEFYNGRTGLTVGVNRLLYSRQSDYQLVEVYETDTWGNLMVIDGMVMLSEKDEFVYHEMLAHVGLFTHPSPERVLIIGGGDGGTAREVMKHSSVQHVDMVEIDETVVEASKKFLPGVGDFENPKLNVLFQDGISFVKNVNQPYDVIMIDGSDPVGPAEGLFEKEFYKHCQNALSGHGVLTAQTESPWVSAYHSSIKKVYSSLEELFTFASLYLSYIPLYPGGMWSMMCASQKDHPLDEIVVGRVLENANQLRNLKYYNSDVHRSCFALPNFVGELVS
ncbi:MAG: polyamine aminopropyltransferase [Balneolaceae bacterium]